MSAGRLDHPDGFGGRASVIVVLASVRIVATVLIVASVASRFIDRPGAQAGAARLAWRFSAAVRLRRSADAT